MYLEYTPSEKTVQMLHIVHRLREKGMLWKDVAKVIGHRREYLTTLYGWYKENKLYKLIGGEKHEETKNS